MKTASRILLIVLFVGAALIRLADAFRPIDHASWRECDLGAISRNFTREGMNPLLPRIDWRGRTPGYAEMEFPLYSWLTAVTYNIFGIHDEIGRFWAFAFSIGTLFFFLKLAREYLDEFAAIAAFAFFALHPLIVEMATSVQPEGLMIFAYVGAAYFFTRWLKSEKDIHFGGAVAFTALTLLAKATAAHIGLFFAVLLIWKYGWSVIRQAKVWAFGVLSVLPAALWYVHAKGLWRLYGNSLGVSNEHHWIGWDFFTDPSFIGGILRNEAIHVWVLSGVVIAAFAVWSGYRDDVVKHSLIWLASIFVLYIVAARTTSSAWAYYYHVFSVPAVALLFGSGAKHVWDLGRKYLGSRRGSGLVTNLGRAVIVLVALTAATATFLLEAKQIRANFLEHRVPDQNYSFAQALRPQLVKPGLILVSGGDCTEEHGYPVAYNASFMFYWLDRKGSNVCVQNHSIERIQGYSSSGFNYFLAQRSALDANNGLEAVLRSKYRIVNENDDYIVFDIDASGEVIISNAK